ncbi:hypothetical protein [uncultured Helicobacter sp.]|uniref:hypothetical protein n=1 Tax=uncultured Helicobacter sp. TaxID=175537 RepID=UPI00374E58D3
MYKQESVTNNSVWVQDDIPTKNNTTSRTMTYFYRILIACALVSSVCVRFYQYIFHKDLWLDEAMLTFSITNISLWDMLSKPLPSLQSAPLGFLLWTRFLYEFFGAGEYVLYFLPFVCSLGTLLVAYKISQTFRDNFTQVLFVLLVCGSLGLLYYATEFKQYGIEAFCGFLLLYLYIKRISLRKFLLISGIAVLFSHTIIFIAIACIMGYTWQSKHNLKAFLKQNTLPILALGVLFAMYYFLYLKHQSQSGFYKHFASGFLPHTLGEYPAFFKETLPAIYAGFSPFNDSFVIPFYAIISLLGFYALYRLHKNLFVFALSSLGIYIALSWLHIYPFGLKGIIGGRLSLYMSSVFFLLCAFGGGVLYNWLKRYSITRVLLMSGVMALTCFTLYQHINQYMKNDHYKAQTHALVRQIAQDSKPDDCVFVFWFANPALSYYTRLDNLTIPKKQSEFRHDLATLLEKTKKMVCQRNWVFAASYPTGDWDKQLQDMIYALDKDAKVYKDKGAILLEFNTQEN